MRDGTLYAGSGAELMTAFSKKTNDPKTVAKDLIGASALWGWVLDNDGNKQSQIKNVTDFLESGGALSGGKCFSGGVCFAMVRSDAGQKAILVGVGTPGSSIYFGSADKVGTLELQNRD